MNDEPAAVPGESRHRHRQQPEREPEEEQRDGALVQVLRPEEGEAAPADQQAERPGERAELPRAAVASEQLPAEQSSHARDHRVERDEQVRVGRANVHGDPGRDAGERGDGDEPGPAVEERCDRDGAEHAHDGRAGVDLRMPVGGEIRGEPGAPGDQGDEPGQPELSPRSEDDEREPDGRDRPAGVCGGAHRFSTTTIARALCGPTETTSGYRPGFLGARRTSRPGFVVPVLPRKAPARRRVGEHADAETRAHLRLDHRARELDIAHAHAQRLRGPDVPGNVLRGDRDHVRAWRDDLAVDLPVPGDRPGRLLPAGEDEPLAVDEEHRMRPLRELVRDVDPVGVPVAVRRDRERHLARAGCGEADHARRRRVHLHLVRQVDRPVLREEMDARLVDALADEAARVVATVPGVGDLAPRGTARRRPASARRSRRRRRSRAARGPACAA